MISEPIVQVPPRLAGASRGQLTQALAFAAFAGLAWTGAPPDGAARAWYVAALATCVAHHGWVSLCWRLELHRRWISRHLGHPRGFHWFRAGFAALAGLRVAAVWGLALADRGTLALAPALGAGLGLVCLGLAVWLFVSVHRYFGMERALGLDHWEPERFRGRPLVRRGIHRLTPNAMYVFGPAILLAAVLPCASAAGLAATAFNAACLWVHYFCTERPDLRTIHGGRGSTSDRPGH